MRTHPHRNTTFHVKHRGSAGSVMTGRSQSDSKEQDVAPSDPCCSLPFPYGQAAKPPETSHDTTTAPCCSRYAHPVPGPMRMHPHREHHVSRETSGSAARVMSCRLRSASRNKATPPDSGRMYRPATPGRALNITPIPSCASCAHPLPGVMRMHPHRHTRYRLNSGDLERELRAAHPRQTPPARSTRISCTHAPAIGATSLNHPPPTLSLDMFHVKHGDSNQLGWRTWLRSECGSRSPGSSPSTLHSRLCSRPIPTS